jgi:adenylyltransferase/sulfurtransferase
MGVGVLGMVEQDVIELSNLHRQLLYGEEDIGKPKIEVALSKLKEMNGKTRLIPHDTFLTRTNALKILNEYDLIVDASDNFATRYLINDACLILNKPFVSGALHGYEGQVSVFNYKDGPTYRCLFPNPPKENTIPDCNTNGILGVLPGIIGSLQALEAVKVLTQTAEVMSGTLLLYNGLDQTMRKVKFPAIPENKLRTTLETEYASDFCQRVPEVDWESLNKVKLENKRQSTLIDVRTREEQCKDPMPGSLHIPLAELSTHLDLIPGKGSLYFICQSGSRSKRAVAILQTRFPKTPMYSVKGGIDGRKDILSLGKNSK